MTAQSLQEQLPHNHCFGCGHDNDRGLRLKSYWSGTGLSVARFSPRPYHCAGPRHFVNGGIIATLIDCHCICTATAAAYFKEGRSIGSEPHLFFVTGALEVRYKRPAPMSAALELEAHIERRTANGYLVNCRLSAGEKLCADATVKAVQVSSTWMTPAEARDV